LFFDNKTDTVPPAYLNIYFQDSFFEENGYLSETQKAMEKQNKDELVRSLENTYVQQGGVLSADKEAAALAARQAGEKLALEERAQMAAEGLSTGAIPKKGLRSAGW